MRIQEGVLMSFVTKTADSAMLNLVNRLVRNQYRPLGIGRALNWAEKYGQLRYFRQYQYRQKQYKQNFDALLRENADVQSNFQLHDGWYADESRQAPHLDQLVSDCWEIINNEKDQVDMTKFSKKFMRTVSTIDHLKQYPSFLNFGLSSYVLRAVCQQMGFIPVLTSARILESSMAEDATPEELQSSQLFHIDAVDKHNVKVWVTLHETTPEHGPFSFLPISSTQKAVEGLDYWKSGKSYRVADEDMFSLVGEDEVISMCYPEKTVFFIDIANCFHYGSRNPVKPRYLLMYSFMSITRAMNRLLAPSQMYKLVQDGDSELRKLMLADFYAGS